LSRLVVTLTPAYSLVGSCIGDIDEN